VATTRDESQGSSDLDKTAPKGAWGSAAGAGAGGGALASNGLQAASEAAGDSRPTDFSAALLAADATRGTSDCGTATDSYDQIAQQAWGTQVGYEATFKAGQCYQALGKNDVALQRFQRLITVPQYAPRAQELINKLSASPPGQGQLLAGARTVTKKPKALPAATPASSAVQQAPAQPAPSGKTQQQWAH
jgi:hypothetical protein